jgi:hypothetical protein
MSHHEIQDQTLSKATARPTECLDDVVNFTSASMQEIFKISVPKPLLQAEFCSIQVMFQRLPFYRP